MPSPVLVTGAAGFIGMHVSLALLARGEQVVGLDDLNDYYDPRLKEARLAQLSAHPAFRFVRADIADRTALPEVFARVRPARVVHLAAQAGVRYSITHPHAYVDTNITGFLNILEAVRRLQGEGAFTHLVYASSSSVYGANTKAPFAVEHRVDSPVSLYAASKRANELMALVYARQFGIAMTGLRFFTVYGPWGRPDMAAFLFARAILAGETIDVFNHGDMRRDFTYIDDIVTGVIAVLDRPAAQLGDVPHALYNIGNHRSEALMHFIDVLAKAIGRTPKMNMLLMQLGDVQATYADTDPLQRDCGWRSTTTIDVGLPKFVAWYRDYYKV